MDLGIRSTRYEPVQESYDGNDYDHELTDLPKSRATSYASTSKISFWDGKDDDDESLIGHARQPSGFDLQRSKNAPRRVDSTISETPTNKDKKKHWLVGHRSGWRFGVSFAAGTATTVLLLNVILTIYAAANFGTSGGVGTAYEGSCDVANKWTTWLHILINGLSSLLLSASNYTMQALSAPTRQEVDRAHAKGDWLDIGVASVRNLFRIKWNRVVLWIVLAISSIPIHLLYNSAVFKTIDANQYTVAVVTPRFLRDGNFSTIIPWSNSYTISSGYSNYTVPTTVNLPDIANLQNIQRNFSASVAGDADVLRFRNMSNTDCINTYSVNFVSGHNNVLAVTDESGSSDNETLFFATQASAGTLTSPDYLWMCYNDFRAYMTTNVVCNTQALKSNASEWTINGKRISYCLAEILPQHCTLQFSLQILIAVIVCNAMKSVAMFITLYKQKDVTLVTVGDAIATYLDRPDETTKDRCLMSRTDIRSWRLAGSESLPNTQPLPKTYFAVTSRWFVAASKSRWAITFCLIILTLIISIILLKIGADGLQGYSVNPFTLGFGAIDSRATISIGLPSSGAAGLVSAVLLANSPQAIVSFLYLLYNSLMTALLLAKEWTNYGVRRKALRVTTPYGAQRSTYYLQLPLRYSGPLLALSATLHWVISQSIFLARINVYNNGVPSDQSDISQVAYSCPPILVAILIGVVLLSAALGMGFMKFRGQMPVASSCSVAIAAACHRPKDDFDAAFLPVQWGEVRGERNDEMGHVCFTSFPVEPLTSGRMYAGVVQPSPPREHRKRE